MHIRLPPLSPPHSPATVTQKSLPSFTKPYNVASSKTPDITSVFFRSNEGPEVPDVTDATNPKLSAKEHYESSMAPLTSPESKPISSTNVLNEACPNPSSILLSLQSTDWIATLEPIPPSSWFYYFIDTLYHKYM